MWSERSWAVTRPQRVRARWNRARGRLPMEKRKNEPDTRHVFAGVDTAADATLPDWYRRRHTGCDVTTFRTAIGDLPRAVTVPVAYRNPCSGNWVETDEHVALVEPTRLRAQAVGRPAVDPLFHVPSDSYAVINPVEAYDPLAAIIRETTVDGSSLGDACFGEVRTYRNGGEVHLDLLFDGLEVTLPGRNDPVALGITTGYDFFGGHAVYVEGYAQDIRCRNSLRQITDRERIKHVGEIGTLEDWWRERLSELDLVRDDLRACIQEARSVTVDLTAVPFDLEEFYSLLGFPEYLARHAADDTRETTDDLADVDLWALHSGATYALTHQFRGREGTTLDRYVRAANDLLFNPEQSIDRIIEAYERQQTAPSDTDPGAGPPADRLRSELERQVAEFERRQSELRSRTD